MKIKFEKNKSLILSIGLFLIFSLSLILLSTFFPESWGKNIIDFFSIWSWMQWSTSLISLVLLYWISGNFYNKKLQNIGGWLDFETRIWLIMIDLLLNLGLGLYYMHYRDTLMGMIMLRCPIAISPVIFVVEMICVYMYYLFWKKK